MRVEPLYPDPRQPVERATPQQHTHIQPVGDPGGVLVLQEYVGRRGDREPFYSGAMAKLRSKITRAVDGPVAFDVVLRDGAQEWPEKSPELHRAWLANTLEHYRPTKIIALGGAAHRALLGHGVPDLKVRKCYGYLGNGIPVVCLPRPVGRVSGNPIYKRWFDADLKWALETEEFPVPHQAQGKVRVIETEEDAWRVYRKLKQAGVWAFDTETFGRKYTDEFKITCLAACIPGHNYAWVWPEAMCHPDHPAAEPLRLLARELPCVGHSLKYDVVALWLHLGVRPQHADHCTRLYCKMARSDTSGYLNDQANRVGMGGHKAEAKDAVDLAANIIQRLRTAATKQVVLETRKEEYTTTTGKRRTRTVPVSTRAPTEPEMHQRIADEWTKVRTKAGAKTTWAELTGSPEPTRDWRTAVMACEHVAPKTYAYGLMDAQVAHRYCALDTIVTGHLYLLSEPEMPPGPRHTWNSFMSGVTTVLAKIQYAGFQIDLERLTHLESVLDQKEQDARRVLARYGAPDTNWNSAQQLAKVLFDPKSKGGLGFPVVGKTDTGAPSTDGTALRELMRRTSHPILPALLGFKEATKLQSNYARGMRPHLSPDGRVHCTLQPIGAETGRGSCSGPNLQTVPSKSDLAKLVKSCFVAPRGRKLVAIDYATLELRVMAMLSGEQSMIDSFMRGEDLHRATARDISTLLWGDDFESCGLGYTFFDLLAEHDEHAAILYAEKDGRVSGLPGWTAAMQAALEAAQGPRWDALADAQKARRKVAKAVNFGVAYGQGPATMAEQWGITEAEADKAQTAIMGKRKKLAKWFKAQVADCRKHGYVDTWWDGNPSTRRFLPDIVSQHRDSKGHAERAAGNTPVQGTGSHYCFASLVALDRWIEDDGIDAKQVLTVHDSIIFEVADEDVDELCYHAARIMTQWDSQGVPVTVDVEVGQDWGHLEPYAA